LHSTKWSDEKKRWKPLSSKTKKKNSMQNSGEENGYTVPDPNTTMINVTREPSDIHKTPSKRKSWK
jgi:hypothetical protein